MQTCVVRPVLFKKVNDLDLMSLLELSESLPNIKIVFDFCVNLKNISRNFFRFRKDKIFKKSLFNNKVKLLLIDFELSAIQQRI